MPLTKQVHDCRVGDILLFKNEESRIITDLAGENRRFDTYDALDEVLF